MFEVLVLSGVGALSRPPLPCRASPPQGGRSAVRASALVLQRWRLARLAERVISPLVGEMPAGRGGRDGARHLRSGLASSPRAIWWPRCAASSTRRRRSGARVFEVLVLSEGGARRGPPLRLGLRPSHLLPASRGGGRACGPARVLRPTQWGGPFVIAGAGARRRRLVLPDICASATALPPLRAVVGLPASALPPLRLGLRPSHLPPASRGGGRACGPVRVLRLTQWGRPFVIAGAGARRRRRVLPEICASATALPPLRPGVGLPARALPPLRLGLRPSHLPPALRGGGWACGPARVLRPTQWRGPFVIAGAGARRRRVLPEICASATALPPLRAGVGLPASALRPLRLGLRPSHLPPALRGGGRASSLAPIRPTTKWGGGGSGEARDGGGETFPSRGAMRDGATAGPSAAECRP